LVNRVLFPYLLDAALLFEEGVDAKRIDDALVEWGMPMGPLRLIDEIGIDITIDIAVTLETAFGERARTPAILTKMREAKMLGRKSGSGIYKYADRKQLPNEAIESWRSQTNRPEIGANDLALRLVYLMVNEAARCLEEKVVASPEDADYGMILGTGFAPLRGGPLRFADHFGIAKMVRAGERHGGKFEPSNLLREHAEKGTKFYGG
jgi:3-hydroxyacyl-CoA dehydrogenase/enoyl-CoA hydratase/3-hydroxybutyryl-CoA epimerase